MTRIEKRKQQVKDFVSSHILDGFVHTDKDYAQMFLERRTPDMEDLDNEAGITFEMVLGWIGELNDIDNLLSEIDNTPDTKTLTVESALQLIGQTIKWSSISSNLNKPYGGLAVIEKVTDNKNCLNVRTISGDDLSHAFTEGSDDIFYSDYGRFVMYEIVEIEEPYA